MRNNKPKSIMPLPVTPNKCDDLMDHCDIHMSVNNGVEPKTGDILSNNDFNNITFTLAAKGPNGLHYLEGQDNSLSSIVNRGETIDSMAIIFYNRALEMFRNLSANINAIFVDKLKMDHRDIYKAMMNEYSRYNRYEDCYDEESKMEFFAFKRVGYAYSSMLNRYLPSGPSGNYSLNTYGGTANTISLIEKLCTMELYLNMDIYAIKMIGLSLVSTVYSGNLEDYYMNFKNTIYLDEYRGILSDMATLLLTHVEVIIETLYNEVQDFYNTNAAALSGPFMSFWQMKDMIAEDREKRISAFIKGE